MTSRDDDDINDVAAMGGVNLLEESRNILAANAELVSGQMRSCSDETFLNTQRLQSRIAEIGKFLGFFFLYLPVVHEVLNGCRN